MRQAAERDVDRPLLGRLDQRLDVLELGVAPHEHAAVVDIGAAEIDEVLRVFVRRLLRRIHDHFRTHVAEQQVVAVLVALLHEQRVADLPRGAGMEFVLERLTE